MADPQQPARRESHTPVAIFAVDSGGCGACVQSILALQATRYAKALHAARVSFAQAPRHADILLISGPLTETARTSIEQVIAATPQQRALIAVGDCAIDGCMFADSPAHSGSAATAFDVHVEIEGCPPMPLAILDAIGAARELLAQAEEEGVIEDTDETADETTNETADASGGPSDVTLDEMPDETPDETPDEVADAQNGASGGSAER
jgi:Ni,Fe-hydrogenase III small subunit